MRHYLLSLLSLVTLVSSLDAQEALVYDNHIYKDYIQTVEFSHNNVPLSLPIVDLNSPGVLKLEFDDREGSYLTYLYRIIHCDKDWNPTDLDEIEYLDGFNNEEIDDFANSQNPYSEYTHYELRLPNDDLNWTLSGNYLLVIFEDETEDLILTRRFVVTENAANIAARITKPQNVSKIRTNQDLEVSIDISNVRMANPLTDVYLTVMQNGNWNSSYTNVNPTYQNAGSIFFDEYEILTFPALKEFRNFDIRNLRFRGDYVNFIERDEDETRVLLDLGKIRNKTYFDNEPDANGGFIIANEDFGGGDVSGEYASVIFTLESPWLEEDVFVVGSFNDWRPNEKYRMEYDYDRNLYYKTIPFKQGYYDYMYAVMAEDGKLNINEVEGSWFETENDYLIIAYYRDIGSEYDRVLDVLKITSYPR